MVLSAGRSNHRMISGRRRRTPGSALPWRMHPGRPLSSVATGVSIAPTRPEIVVRTFNFVFARPRMSHSGPLNVSIRVEEVYESAVRKAASSPRSRPHSARRERRLTTGRAAGDGQRPWQTRTVVFPVGHQSVPVPSCEESDPALRRTVSPRALLLYAELRPFYEHPRKDRSCRTSTIPDPAPTATRSPSPCAQGEGFGVRVVRGWGEGRRRA